MYLNEFWQFAFVIKIAVIVASESGYYKFHLVHMPTYRQIRAYVGHF